MKYLMLALEWIPILWLGITAIVILALAIFGGSINVSLGADK